ncbi:MAG: hypothetical protein DPW18_20380 [Chloroflexi bacterium]|nr:hypothetical protein Rctr41k_50 [Virus Rctr41k]MCQ3939377.1 hypothetical protein [Chloroflexota bacterium]
MAKFWFTLIVICSIVLIIMELRALKTRVEKLASGNRQRMPHQAQDNILDVIALVSDVLENEQDLNLLESQRRAREQQKLANAIDFLKNALAVGTKRDAG